MLWFIGVQSGRHGLLRIDTTNSPPNKSNVLVESCGLSNSIQRKAEGQVTALQPAEGDPYISAMGGHPAGFFLRCALKDESTRT